MFALQYEGVSPRFGARLKDYGPAHEINKGKPMALIGKYSKGPHGKQIVCNPAPIGESLFEPYSIECGADSAAEVSLTLINAKTENSMVAFVSKYGLPFNQLDMGKSLNNSISLSSAMKANKWMIECQTLLLPQFAKSEDGQQKLFKFMNRHIPPKSNETNLDWQLGESGKLVPIIKLKNPFTFALLEMLTAKHYGRGIHTCPNCNEFFTAGKTANNKTKWCSPACRQSSYRKRKNL